MNFKNKHERRTCTLYKRDTVAAAATYIIYIYIKFDINIMRAGRGIFFLFSSFVSSSCFRAEEINRWMGLGCIGGGVCTERMDTIVVLNSFV